MPGQIRHLCLWAPDLFRLARSLPDKDSPVHQLLARFLSRSKSRCLDADPLEALFDFASSETAVTLAACADDVVVNDRFVLRADPVQLIPDMDHLVLQSLPDDALTSAEASALIAAFNTLYTEEGIELILASPNRWYLLCNKPLDARFTTLAQVDGQNIFTHMPAGKDKLFWTKLMNETQMLFHHHDVNTRRQQQHRIPINSIWLWGNNSISAHSDMHWTAVYSNDVVIKGAAMKSRSVVAVLPDNLSDILPHQQDAVLIHYDYMPHTAAHNITDSLDHFYEHWFRPACDALMNEQIEQLTLLPDNRNMWTATRRSLRQWWRRNRKLTSYIDASEDPHANT